MLLPKVDRTWLCAVVFLGPQALIDNEYLMAAPITIQLQKWSKYLRERPTNGQQLGVWVTYDRHMSRDKYRNTDKDKDKDKDSCSWW